LTDARCRITVVGEQNRVDLAIPAHAPIAEYSDTLARLCGQSEDEALPPAWSLAPIGAPAFALTSSLAAEGVEDGAVLYLRDTLSGEAEEPVTRSIWELVANGAPEPRGGRWNVRVAGRLAVLLGAFWMMASLFYSGLTGQHTRAAGVTAGILGACLAGLAWLLRRHPRVLPGILRTVLGCGVVPCTVLAAVLAPGPVRADLTHVIYAEIGLWLGLIIALLCVPGVLLGALVLLTTCAGVITGVAAALHPSTAAVAATVVVLGTLMLAVAPRVAAMLVAMSWLSLSSPTMEPEADPELLSERVESAHRALIVMASVTSVAVGVALIVLTRHFGPFSVAVAVVATLVLFARGATFELVAEALAPVLAGLAGVFGLATMLAGGAAAAYLMPALLLIGAAGVAAGLPVLLWGADRHPSGDDSSTRLGPLLTVGQIVLPALLLGVYGLYTTLWSLGR
jgi:ESX secretion system protein EccD